MYAMGLILDLKITKMYLRGTACTHPQSSQQSESCSQAGGPHTDLGFFHHKYVEVCILEGLQKRATLLAFGPTSLDFGLYVT